MKSSRGNVLKTAELIHPKTEDKWVLVTFAFHKPRSVGLFRKAGFKSC
ncbi:YdcF family protein [Candidatus Dependentiae bacterium]|nr:YdcF family protein [Candidatus Dependentiae bacterium]